MREIYIIVFVILLSTLYSCNKLNPAEQKIYNHIKVYQYHKKDVSDFSFLSKYKNLEVLDLRSSGVSDLSFLKDLKKLRWLLLDKNVIKSKKLEKEIEEKYYTLESFDNITNLREYTDMSFTDVFLGTDKLDYMPLKPFTELIRFNDISGLELFKNLQTLKIVLKDDEYVNSITNIKGLKELHLGGKIFNLPVFQYSLEKLYLYNCKELKDFSFLKKSNIKFLYIVTKDYKSNRWSKIKKEHPNIEIKVENLLFLPVKSIYPASCFNNPKVEEYTIKYFNGVEDKNIYYFYIKDIYLHGNCYVINTLRKNILNISLIKESISFLIYEVGIDINHLWLAPEWHNKKITFLDKVIEEDSLDTIDYLLSLNGEEAKRSCEILNKECSKVSGKIQELLDKRR